MLVEDGVSSLQHNILERPPLETRGTYGAAKGDRDLGARGEGGSLFFNCGKLCMLGNFAGWRYERGCTRYVEYLPDGTY